MLLDFDEGVGRGALGPGLILSVLVASGLVLVFGKAALRRQRKQFELAHRLTISEGEPSIFDKTRWTGNALRRPATRQVARPLDSLTSAQ